MSELLKLLRPFGDIASGSLDAFNKLIADGTTNRGDLASHFTYSPESYRLFRNGSRVQLQYDTDYLDDGETPHFRDELDAYVMKPDAGDTMAFASAERFRYVVAYESEFSVAWEASRELNAGESIQILFAGGQNGGSFGQDAHGIEYTADGATQFAIRNGTRVIESDADTESETAWSVYNNTFNWYNAGRKRGREIFGDGEQQQVTDVGTVIEDRERAQRIGNGRIVVKVDSVDPGLEVAVGSMGFVNQGQTTPKTRAKTFPVNATVDTADTYVPLAAFRIKPGEELVTTDLAQIVPVAVQDGETQFHTVAVDPSNTDVTDADFSTPEPTSPVSNAVEFTTAITQFPDSDGNLVTSTTTPGGYQIAWSRGEVSGSGVNTQLSGVSRERRRRLHDLDHGIVLANAGTTGDVEFDAVFEQEK